MEYQILKKVLGLKQINQMTSSINFIKTPCIYLQIQKFKVFICQRKSKV